MRYVNLSNILALKLIAPKVDKRFPSYQTLVDAKVLLPKEVNQWILMNKLVISLDLIPKLSSHTSIIKMIHLLIKG